MEEIIFLDNASTTKINSEVNDLVYKTNIDDFYNPSALYHKSVLVQQKIEDSTNVIANALNVNSKNIIFTSGATEANNLAILGSFTAKKDAEYIFSSGEHPSVYNTAKVLQQKGCKVHLINLLPNGQIDIEHLKSLLNNNTHFVSIMFVSNETGVVNDIEYIGKILKNYNNKIIFHVDGVQAFGKIKTDLSKLNVDAFTISAHKFQGPKGIGALYYKNTNALKTQIYGGGQQQNLRSGTENVSGILGMALATKISQANIQTNYNNAVKCKQYLINYINQNLKDIEYEINGENTSPYITSISFKGLKSEILMHMLEQNGLIVGTGSACSSKKQQNRVLENMNKKPEFIKGNIRISLSFDTTLQQIEKASKILVDTVIKLKNQIQK